MGHLKFLNWLNETDDSKFLTIKRTILNDQSNANFDAGEEISYHKKVLKSHLLDSKDTYILVRGNITIMAHTIIQVTFKHCSPFTKYIIKIDRTTINDAKDLDLFMPMHNFSNYSDITCTLWFFSKDE